MTHQSRRVRMWKIAAVLLTLAACAGADGIPGRSTTRDSAGVRIIQNPSNGRWSPDQAWTVVPSFSLREASGDSAHLFGHVSSIAVDAAGRIIVLDQLALQILIFDEEGRLVNSIGRAGRGPGEFSPGISDVLIAQPDTILVPEPARARLQLFTAEGELIRVANLALRPPAQSWEPFADATLLFHGQSFAIDQQEPTRVNIWDGILRTSHAFDVLDTVLVLDYDRSQFEQLANPRLGLILNAPIWSRFGEDRIAWSSLERTEILVHDGSGRLTSIIRSSAWKRKPVTADDRAALHALLLEKARLLGADPARLDTTEIDYGERLPAITSLQAGPDGTLWVQLMGPVNTIDPRALNAIDARGLGGTTWHVLDAQGRLLGSIELPARFRLMSITPNALYGVRRDEQVGERVERLGLVRGIR